MILFRGELTSSRVNKRWMIVGQKRGPISNNVPRKTRECLLKFHGVLSAGPSSSNEYMLYPRPTERRQQKGGQIIVEQWPARLLPRSPFTLCKRTPEALRILNTRRPTLVPSLVFALETGVASRPSAQEFYQG